MFFLLVVFDLCRLCRIVLRLVLGLDLQQQLLDVRAVVEGLVHDEGKLRREAQGFIDSYFETYPKIKEFLDNTVAQAKEKGYTRTLFGRIRPIPELSVSGVFFAQPHSVKLTSRKTANIRRRKRLLYLLI